MAYNQELAQRLRAHFEPFPEEITEKKMFGGMAFLYKGKMTVGIIKDELCCRVVSSKMDKVLQSPNVRPMDFTGKPMKEFVFVSPDELESEEQLSQWIELGVEHAKSKL